MPKFKNNKLCRDMVISVLPYGDRVGIYLKNNPFNLLVEMSPIKADKIIKQRITIILSHIPSTICSTNCFSIGFANSSAIFSHLIN